MPRPIEKCVGCVATQVGNLHRNSQPSLNNFLHLYLKIINYVRFSTGKQKVLNNGQCMFTPKSQQQPKEPTYGKGHFKSKHCTFLRSHFGNREPLTFRARNHDYYPVYNWFYETFSSQF